MKYVLSLCAMLAATLPASAGWQWTEWGMSLAEVEKASPTPISISRQNGDRTWLHTSHAAVGYSFEVELMIRDQGLESVVLSSSDGNACKALKAGLVAKYGSSQPMAWPDAPEGFVMYGESAGTCKLLYGAPIEPSTDGL